MSEQTFNSIRDTPLGKCIGQTIVDVTTTVNEELELGVPTHVYFHLGNGKKIFASIGNIGSGLVGMVND